MAKGHAPVRLTPIQALVRFNEQLAKNTQLRTELETLRVERIRFQQLQRKLDKVRGHADTGTRWNGDACGGSRGALSSHWLVCPFQELRDIHRDIGEVINQSTNAYDSR